LEIDDFASRTPIIDFGGEFPEEKMKMFTFIN
jgi:hypothetical protein